MLSIRGFFIFIFCVLFLFFAGLSYALNNQRSQKEAYFMAEQRLQKMSLLIQKLDLSPSAFVFIGKTFGVDVFVDGLLKKKDFQAKEEVFLKVTKDDRNYVLTSSFVVKQDFFNPFLLSCFAFCILLMFWALYYVFKMQFRRIFSPLGEGMGKFLMFFEINLFSHQLQRIKKTLLKKEAKNIKQAKKIKLKNIQLSNLISAISHELKNPLSVISLCVEGLENPKINQKEIFISKIKHQIFRLNSLTHKLNFVFNLDSNHLQFEDFDLFAVVQGVIDAQNEKRLKFIGQKTLVRGDVFLIEQVVINLISNALKYSQDEVLIEVKEGEFKITDYGIGIEKNQFKKITKKFYRVNSKSENSFGLGLFIVKKILVLHQSTLCISSNLGKKTSFSFVLSTSNPKA